MIRPFVEYGSGEYLVLALSDSDAGAELKKGKVNGTFTFEDVSKPGAAMSAAFSTAAPSASADQPIIKAMGVLGITRAEEQTQNPKTVAPGHAVVDPAGLDFILANRPEGAGVLSAAIYKFVGIVGTDANGNPVQKNGGFPQHVRSDITAPCQAAYATYSDNVQTTHVIHVVGPDFRTTPLISWHHAIAELSTAYKSVIAIAEGLSDDVKVIRLPVISGGVFAGKFGGNIPIPRTVPELTARAVCAAFAARGVLRRKYWLCTYNDSEPFHQAFKFARSTRHYNYKASTASTASTAFTASTSVTEEQHEHGAVGFAIDLTKADPNSNIGIMVAGNSGRPGGAAGLGLDDVPTINNTIAGKGFEGKLTTQEESVVSEWLYGEFPDDEQGRARLFRSTICGMWGQTKPKGNETIQDVDYTTTQTASDYADAWVVRDATLRSRRNDDTVKATLVFVAGPNASNKAQKVGKTVKAGKASYGSMEATANEKATTDYAFFKECVEASVRAGLKAMKEEGVTHALVARVSCAVYAGEHKTQINQELPGIVEGIVKSIPFEQVTIVTVPP